MRLALKVLLDLDVATINRRARRTRLSPDALSRFGARASRLGIDLIVSDSMEDEATLDITLGPVSLPIYLKYQTAEGKHRVQQVLHLVLPYHLESAVWWLVGNTNRAPRLGIDQENSVLGIKAQLGRS